MSQLFIQGGQSIGASASASVHPMNIQDWFSLGLNDLSLGLETEDKGPWPGKPGPGQDNNEKSTHPSFTFLLWKRFMCDVTGEKCAVKNVVTWGPTQNSIQVYLLPLLVSLLFFLKAVKTLNSICLSEGGGWQYRNHRAVVRSQGDNFQVTLGYETKERSKMNLMTAHGLGGSEEKWVGHLAHWQHFSCLRILCSTLGLSLFILFMGFSRQEYWSGLLFPSLPNHCRWWPQPWNKKMLLLRRNVMTNLDSILKSRDITLPTKVHLVKAMVFPVMYGYESWTVKKAERQRIDAFKLWCWRRLLRVPWTARRPNQSILKEVSPECSLEGLI